MLVDTHCHLHLLDEPAGAVVGRALAEGVGHLVDVGVDLASSLQAAANAAGHAAVSAAAGVHPHSAGELTAEAGERLEELAARPEVVAVGETGLDYFRNLSPPRRQREAFAVHIRLARALDKALVVHCRDAFEDVVALLHGEGAPERVVFHCFTGDAAMAARVVEAGWTVSFSGNVTFRNAPSQRAACAAVPLDRMVLETDSPFLAPHPQRGRPNRPGLVRLTAEAVARAHGTSVEAVAAATTATAARVFRLPVP
ncbi:MAG TPA: TatD family hydrolase [Actinomycetes bacterium]|nr:TatD family hydrolase [Actinomycetes bacterium]